MGLFTPRGIKRIARVAVLVAALATACQSRSEKFLSLVQAKDQAVAAQLIKDPRKEKEWKKALRALDELKYLLGEIRYKKDLMTRPGLSIILFLGDALDKVKENILAAAQRELQILREVGLNQTADDLEKEIKNGLVAIDEQIANNITKSVAGIQTFPKLKAREIIFRDNIIERLQLLLQGAKRAGFTKTTSAASNALINLRAAFAK